MGLARTQSGGAECSTVQPTSPPPSVLGFGHRPQPCSPRDGVDERWPVGPRHSDGSHAIHVTQMMATMAIRDEQQDTRSSRAATNRLLLDLRTRGWRPAGWRRFLAAATARSVEQAVVHRRALGQATTLHGLFLIMGKGSRRRWVATSWALTALHLGMLEDRSDLGAANTLTLVRANLPATGCALGPWLAFTALATDFVDGKLARHTGTTTPFGRHADSLADAAFWTWIAFARDGRGGRTIKAAVLLTWLAPILSVTVRSFLRGEIVEPPRPRRIRPAVALQILIAVRALQPGRDAVARNERLEAEL